MYQITTEEIEEETINKYVPSNIKFREKLKRKINEHYQYNVDCFREANEGNYSFIEQLLERHIFHYC